MTADRVASVPAAERRLEGRLAPEPGRVRARVLLVGFEDQDNLGLRYLSSRLKAEGHHTRIVAFGQGSGPVLEAVRELRPHVVGFSLIFQFMAPQFHQVLTELRAAGVTAHFTMGGHYASFEHQALLAAIPELDSVVRYEGEDTLLELAERIANQEPWTGVAGLAYRTASGAATSAPRHGRDNLDELPWPDRDDIRYEARAMPTASMLGSRGCPWVCSFCSIITFYEGNGTKGRRRRDPARIADELEYLHRERGVRIILWQDDDFLAGGPAAVRWAHSLADETIRRGLHHGLRWKLSCRSDEVRPSSLQPLVEAGLTHVYLGVESGDKESLRNMNKRLEPDVHLRAGDTLRQLGLTFDFGFMLMEPWSTIASVRNNIAFLRRFVGDGASPATFCRMLPYVGTASETRLRDEGRLFENNLRADYNFLDPRLDVFYTWMLETFNQRNFTASGTLNLLRLLMFEANLKLPDRPVRPMLKMAIQAIASVNNLMVFDILDAALDYVESATAIGPSGPSGVDSAERAADRSGDSNSADRSDDRCSAHPFLRMLTREHSTQDARSREDIKALLSQLPAAREPDHACV
ncbi:MAG TPA: radical SAM protein [Terriglobia bacterium]|nr:radical SAM protein [Terriglobia bacterium]